MMSLHPKPDIAAFAKLCEQQTKLSDYPLAQTVEKNILCYAGDTLRAAERDKSLRTRLLQEISSTLQSGPGVLVIKAAYTDMAVLEDQNAVFETILQREADKQTGDHFAKAGANGRIWNSLQKSALLNPQSFINYYKNPLIALVSEAWLGPDFQMTAQVNIVRPGGQAQSPHRDYHLGFQSAEVLEQYPAHVHKMSSMLTLQGAIAHTDMPLESGPTLLLPYSQQYEEGYLAWRDAAFKTYFEQNAVQLPIKQGDAVFFNPALFHAAGSNHTTDFHRSANLLQVSSAFG
ncbi:MAG: phytanoyl-CoA dioxygenase family protein, partial [Thiolinea sp.]